ncbi:hypothetical protein [Sphingomonas sp. SUN039]|uniref:hypothetical protein n=1 Tax=Sphingomonas sp. SUN039 TaxID=2937787 RepID=UPI0021644E8F|nr:hypothetical protein [Sphingomonas sp. SUN039]UVO54606.1 hypothetical protein M0209_10910 [Sphingomonas sp. SUN039]
MGKRAASLLASLAAAGVLAACVPPAPLKIAGALPPPATSYSIVGEDDLSIPARTALARGLAIHSMMPAASGKTPERLISVTLADRPRASGTAVGTTLPASQAAPGWVDRPVRDGWFSKGRREVRLTIRFLSPDGQLREERVAQEIVTRKAPAADMARLIEAALHP